MEVNGTILVQVIIFVSILLWLSKFLFAPMLRLFAEREKRIIGAQQEAVRMSKKAEDKALSFEENYKQAQDSARQALGALKQSTDREQHEALEQVRALARTRLQQAEKDLLEQEGQVRHVLIQQSDQIAHEIAKKIIGAQA